MWVEGERKLQWTREEAVEFIVKAMTDNRAEHGVFLQSLQV